MILGFEWYAPTKIICGQNSIDELGVFSRLLGKEALLVTGLESMRRLGYVDRAKQSLEREGIIVQIYEGIPSEPEFNDITPLVQFARSNPPDFIVALGGGSVIDAAKCAAIATTHPGNILDYCRGGRYANQITPSVLPVVAIPSTSGSGSETSSYAVISNPGGGVKEVMSSPNIYPVLCIIDPDLPMNAPNSVKLSSGLDVLAHSIESYISTKASPVVETLSIGASGLVFRCLPSVIGSNGDLRAHAEMAVASAMAGMAIAMGGTVMGHAIAHAWGAVAHVPHGLAVAGLLPWVIEVNKHSARDKLARLWDTLSPSLESMSSGEKVQGLGGLLVEFYRNVGFDMSQVRSFMKGISVQEVAAVASRQAVMALNPEPVTVEVICQILRGISSGKSMEEFSI